MTSVELKVKIVSGVLILGYLVGCDVDGNSGNANVVSHTCVLVDHKPTSYVVVNGREELFAPERDLYACKGDHGNILVSVDRP